MTTEPHPSTETARSVRGAILGVLWYLNGGTPLWEHAIRMFLVMVVALVVLELLARRKHDTGDRLRIAHWWIIAAKLALLVLAISAEWLLRQWTNRANLIIAIGLAAVVALCGPMLQPHLIPQPG
jgi:hypothetical protein